MGVHNRHTTQIKPKDRRIGPDPLGALKRLTRNKKNNYDMNKNETLEQKLKRLEDDLNKAKNVLKGYEKRKIEVQNQKESNQIFENFGKSRVLLTLTYCIGQAQDNIKAINEEIKRTKVEIAKRNLDKTLDDIFN